MMARPCTAIISTLDVAKTPGRQIEVVLNHGMTSEKVVVDSQSNDGTGDIAAAMPGVRAISIAREVFDHGGTRERRMGAGGIVDPPVEQTANITINDLECSPIYSKLQISFWNTLRITKGSGLGNEQTGIQSFAERGVERPR